MGSSRAEGAGPLPALSAPLQGPPRLPSGQPTSRVLEKQRCPWLWDKRSCPPTKHGPGLREAKPRAAAQTRAAPYSLMLSLRWGDPDLSLPGAPKPL